MAVPCLDESNTAFMEIDEVSGRLVTHVKIVTNGGLDIIAGTGSFTGLRIAGITAGKGMALDASGHIINRHSFGRVGWLPGQNGVVNAGTVVGPGGYVQVGDIPSMNLTRLGRANQWVELTYAIECYVTLQSPGSANDFYGWSVQIERSYDSGAWTEVCREDSGGRQSARHHMETTEDILISDDNTHNVRMRLTARGALQGNAVVASYDKRHMKYRGM